MSANTNYNYYEILGVSMNASQDDLKKAYGEAAIKSNPCRGGDSEKLKEIVKAYMVLSDPEKREMYDKIISSTEKMSANTNYYEILGVSMNASQDHLKKAYSVAAIMNNPLRGGDREKLKETAQAYMVLSDPEKREIYDKIISSTEKMSANTNYYEILGVSMNASQDLLKKAYRVATIMNNPLRGGDREKLKAIVIAYKVLSDPEKREIYDQPRISWAEEMSKNTNFYEILRVSMNASQDDLEKAYRKAAILNSPRRGGDRVKLKAIVQAYMVLSDPEKREIYDKITKCYSSTEKMSANSNFYEILGVSMNASQDHLKKAYKVAAIMNNPLRGGDKLKAIVRAYMVLSDPEKREIYDQYGVPGQICPLMVSLEDLYHGTSKKLNLSCSVICSKCNGKGSKSGASMKCSASGATGETINDEDPCEQCKGEKKVVEEEKVLEVHVEKGMQNGQKIAFPETTIDTVRECIVFILQQEEHPKFKRKGDDLHVEHTLSLMESLCGFEFVLTHLDNRQLTIKSQPGEIIKPGQVKEMNDEGMPIYQRPSMRGKLYIHFTVEYPDSLPPEQFKAIEAVVTPRPSPQLTGKKVDEEETCNKPKSDWPQE